MVLHVGGVDIQVLNLEAKVLHVDYVSIQYCYAFEVDLLELSQDVEDDHDGQDVGTDDYQSNLLLMDDEVKYLYLDAIAHACDDAKNLV